MYLVAFVDKETGQVEAFQTFNIHTMAVSCFHLLSKSRGVETRLEDFLHNEQPCNVRVDLNTHRLELLVEEANFHDWL